MRINEDIKAGVAILMVAFATLADSPRQDRPIIHVPVGTPVDVTIPENQPFTWKALGEFSLYAAGGMYLIIKGATSKKGKK